MIERSHLHLSTANGSASKLILTAPSYGPHGRGARISYTIVDSPFGRILVAATPDGVCSVGVHGSDARLESDLHADFSAAEITRDAYAMRDRARDIVNFVTGEKSELDLPLDIRATPFQLEVWKQLCAIPCGATRSYGEIARRLGRPDAARAVGHANGSNPLAIIIPCHRAVGSDGTLTGYRWGLEYKRRLLDHERALTQRPLSLAIRT